MAGGGARGNAPDARASALGLPHGQPQPPKRLSPSWDTTKHSGVQREVSPLPPFPQRGHVFRLLSIERDHRDAEPFILKTLLAAGEQVNT